MLEMCHPKDSSKSQKIYKELEEENYKLKKYNERD